MLRIKPGGFKMFPQVYEKVKDSILKNKSKIIKIGDTYELSADLCNEIVDILVSHAKEEGYSVLEELKVHYVSDKRIIVSKSFTFEKNGISIKREAIGEATDSEKLEIMARTAETRAYKRLVELILGKHIINEVILSINQYQIKQNELKLDRLSYEQLNTIKSYMESGLLSNRDILELRKMGKIRPVKREDLTYEEAQIIIDYVKNKNLKHKEVEND